MHLRVIQIIAFVFVATTAFFPTFVVAQLVPPIPRPPISRGETPTQSETISPNQDETTPTTPQTSIQPGPEQPITLSAKIQEGGTFIPNGLTWRIFDTKTDDSGELALLFKSEEATVTLSLPVGEYLVHVAYGRAQSSDTLLVKPGPNIKSVVLDAGALRLNSAVTTEIEIQPDQLKFDIFAIGLEGEQVPVVRNVKHNATVHLNAGIYNIVSHWGDQNAIVRADIRVEPGQVTEATLFHQAAQVSFSLVSSPGGEAIADVEWQVQDQSGELIFSHLGAFPSAILAEGDYIVIAKSGNAVYNREFQVQAGRPIEIDVLTTVY